MTVLQKFGGSFPLAKMVLCTVSHFIVLLYKREKFLQEARFELENFSHRFPMSGRSRSLQAEVWVEFVAKNNKIHHGKNNPEI